MNTKIYMENRTKERGLCILRYTWRIELRRVGYGLDIKQSRNYFILNIFCLYYYCILQ